MVSNGQALASPRDVFFRDPSSFVPGELYNHYQEWEKIAPNGEADEVLSFIRDGVDVSTYSNSYKGTFPGQDYDSPYPPPGDQRLSEKRIFYPHHLDTSCVLTSLLTDFTVDLSQLTSQLACQVFSFPFFR